MNFPRYPSVVVPLQGEDGNAFAIMGRVRQALRRAGVGQEELDRYWEEATSGDYYHLLAVTQQWVTTDDPLPSLQAKLYEAFKDPEARELARALLKEYE